LANTNQPQSHPPKTPSQVLAPLLPLLVMHACVAVLFYIPESHAVIVQNPSLLAVPWGVVNSRVCLELILCHMSKTEFSAFHHVSLVSLVLPAVSAVAHVGDPTRWLYFANAASIACLMHFVVNSSRQICQLGSVEFFKPLVWKPDLRNVTE